MLLTTLAFAFAQGIANVMDNLNYQVVGIMVVMLCLGGMAVILTVSGSIAAAIQNRAKAKTAAPVAVPAAAPAAAGKPGMTPEMLAILSAAVDSAMTELTPEMVAVISAAVDAGLDGMSHRIVEIKQSPGSGYAAAGRNFRLPPHPAFPLNYCIIHPYPAQAEPFNLISHTTHYYEETSHHRRRQSI